MLDDEPYQNAVLGYTERRLAARREVENRQQRRMPDVTTCPNCTLTYYQTSAPHVCAGWTTTKKENAMDRNRTGYPVIDGILESIAPSDNDDSEEHVPNEGEPHPASECERQGCVKLGARYKRLREQWDTRINTLCGNCGKRYLGPRDNHLHGLGKCEELP